MRAVLCKHYGSPDTLSIEEVPSPPLAADQVRVAVRACGVNFPDTLIIQGKYQYKPEPPFSPGAEIAGVVAEVGPRVQGYRPGDRVIGMVGWGGYAEEVITDPERLLRLPQSMDFVTGAGFSMTYGTSYHALKQRARLQAGETLLVLGATGGVGLAAVELGKRMGGRVIAAGGSDEKLQVARDSGADEVINYSREKIRDRVKALTGGQGAEVIYDAVGGEAFDEAIRCIRWEGRLLVVGFASGRIPQLPVNLVLLKGCQIVGVFWGAFCERDPEANAENFRELFAWHAAGELKPHISKTYPLEQATEALQALLERRVTGKIVLTTKPQDSQ